MLMDKLSFLYFCLLVHRVSLVFGQKSNDEGSEKRQISYEQNATVKYHEQLSPLFHTSKLKEVTTTEHANVRRAAKGYTDVPFVGPETSLELNDHSTTEGASDHTTVSQDHTANVENSTKTVEKGKPSEVGTTAFGRTTSEETSVETTLKEQSVGPTSTGSPVVFVSPKTPATEKPTKTSFHGGSNLDRNIISNDPKEENKTDIKGANPPEVMDETGAYNEATSRYRHRFLIGIPTSIFLLKYHLFKI